MQSVNNCWEAQDGASYSASGSVETVTREGPLLSKGKWGEGQERDHERLDEEIC